MGLKVSKRTKHYLDHHFSKDLSTLIIRLDIGVINVFSGLQRQSPNS